MPLIPISGNTQAQMKLDIADELARPDLLVPNPDIPGQNIAPVASAIATAIDAYQQERFFWSESRANVFQTVGGQEFYNDSQAGFALSTLMGFDYVVLYLGGTGLGTGAIPWLMNRATEKELELLNQNGLVQGQPYNYGYFNQQLRLGPIPDTVYTIRVVAHMYTPPPANDAATNNPWMTYAERLIRSRAKYELLLHVIRNPEEAEVVATAVTESFEMLKGRTNRLVGQSIFLPMEF